MKIYIAGPMTGLENFNFPAFFEAEEELSKNGREVINPARLDDGDTTKPWKYYIKRDVELLLGCDCITLLEGWERSRGATLEALIAYTLGFEVMIPKDWYGERVWVATGLSYITERLDMSLLIDDINVPASILPEAEKLVHGARQDDYGHPYEDFSRTAQMWSAILGQEVTASQVGLCMIAVKLSREVNKSKRDNLVDIAGYAETVRMVLEEGKRRNES